MQRIIESSQNVLQVQTPDPHKHGGNLCVWRKLLCTFSSLGPVLVYKLRNNIMNTFLLFYLAHIVQPHYNAPHYNAVFNIAQLCHGYQTEYFAICL